MKLSVGIPKELKVGEKRVSLTPKGVRYLTQNGIQVYVEKNAGFLSGFLDSEYAEAGGILIASARELWAKAELIKKVKEPIQPEFPYFSAKHIIFTYLHLASPSAKSLIAALQTSKATAVAYETIEKSGQTPLLKPMSEVAGVLVAFYGVIFQTHLKVSGQEIKGVTQAKQAMLEAASNYPAVPHFRYRGKMMILGGGYVGTFAAETAAKMGAEIWISEISDARRRQLSEYFNSRNLKVHILNPADSTAYHSCLGSAEVIIGAVHSAGKRAPLVIDDSLLGQISRQKKKIILDVSIDQGGNVAQSKPTNYEDPLYLDSFGNIRFSVTNIPSLCGRGAAIALEDASLEYTLQLAQGLDQAIQKYSELKTGINVLKGDVVHPAVLEALGL